jgi:hypothetical protein
MPLGPGGLFLSQCLDGRDRHTERRLPLGMAERKLRRSEFRRRPLRKTEMQCAKCGSEMRRLVRESLLQKRVYPLFGFYPWECPLCREPTLFKKRYERRRRSRPTDFSAMEAGTARPSNQASAAVPAPKAR